MIDELSGMRCWGRNGDGELGVAPAATIPPTHVTGSFSTVGLGDFFGCAVDGALETYCSGINDNGQLGDGTLVARATRNRIMTLESATMMRSRAGTTCVFSSRPTRRRSWSGLRVRLTAGASFAGSRTATAGRLSSFLRRPPDEEQQGDDGRQDHHQRSDPRVRQRIAGGLLALQEGPRLLAVAADGLLPGGALRGPVSGDLAGPCGRGGHR